MPIGAQPRRARGSFSVRGSTRTTTTGEPSSRLSAPSGSADAKLPISIASARRGSPSVVTSRRPRRHGVSLGASPSPGPSAVTGTTSAPASPAPATPAAAPSARRRVIPSPPRRRSRASASSSSRPRGVLAVAVLDGELAGRRRAWRRARRGRQAGQRAAERRAEQLGLRVGDDERRRRRRRPGRREDEQHRDGQLRARVGAARGARPPGARRSWRRAPRSGARPRAGATMARNHVTIPSGTGPRLPMPQPPRLSGWRIDCT